MSDLRMAAAYIRVSTDDQMELSPDSQLVKIREYAAKNNLLLLPDHIFHDDGISGRAAEKRPGFQRMIATAKDPAHPFDVIIVWKFSRFARNQEESIFYKSILRSKCKVDVVSVSEPLIAGPFGSLIERIIEWMDEFYSIRLSEEVKRSMTVNAKKGNLQSTPPFGYRAENHMLVPVPDEAEIVRDIFQRFVAGEAMFAIARSINARGIRTHRGSPFENRTVDYILNNPAYIGKLRWTPTGKINRDFRRADSIVADASHEAIVPLDVWDAAQARVLELKQAYQWHSKPAEARKHWLCGLVRCPACGSTLVSSGTHYMQCNGRLRSKCTSSQHIAVELLADAFIAQLQHDLTFADNVDCVIRRAASRDPAQDLQQQRSRLVGRLSRLRDAYLDGAESLENYKASRAQMQSQLDDLDKKIADASSASATDTASSLRAAISAVLDTLLSPTTTMEQKHEAAKRIVDKCYFDKSQMLLSISYRLTV